MFASVTAAAGSLCAFAALIALSHGYVRVRVRDDLHVAAEFENDSTSSLINTNGTEKTSNNRITEFFDPQKGIMASKTGSTGECILRLVDDRAEISNVQNKIFDSKTELSGDEMIEIIGEDINEFCENNVIVLKNYDDDDRSNRSKRSTDKKRYQGQTQTQFVSFGSKDSNQQTKNGLAEALSQPDLSRATVSGLNGMGQAQSQSSFDDCDECNGQNYRTHPTHIENTYPSTHPDSGTNNRVHGKPDQRYGTGPSASGQYPNVYPGSGTNFNVPSKQDQGYSTNPSVSGQYPNVFPGSGTNNNIPIKQDQIYGTGPPVSGQYPNVSPGSGTSYNVPSKQDQGYGIGPPSSGQNTNVSPGSQTNYNVPSKQDQGYGIGPPSSGQNPNIYPGSGTNYNVPSKQDQGYGIGPPPSGQNPNIYPGSGTNYNVPSKQDQGYGIGPPSSGQNPNIYPGLGTINNVPSKQDQGYGTGPSISGQYPNVYPGLGTNNNIPIKHDQGYGTGSSVSGQYPNVYPGPGINNRVSGNQNQGDKSYINNQYPRIYSDLGNNKPSGKENRGYSSSNEQNPNPFNTNSQELKKPVNNDEINQNIYSVDSGLINPSGWNYPNKLANNHKNQQNYPYGSGFPSFPSGSAQGILAPNNFDLTNPSTNTKIPVTTSVEYQNRPTNYPHQISTNLNQKTPISDVSNSQNIQRTGNKAVGSPPIMQNGYPSLWNTQGNEGLNQLNLPSLCNYLYQSCLNALLNSNKPNEFQTTPSLQNIERNPNNGKQFEGIGISNIGQPSSSLFKEKINQNIVQPSYGQPQDSLGTGEPGFQQPGYIPPGGSTSPYQIQPSYGQPQNALITGGAGVQQPGYIPSGGNMSPNQIQTDYRQPHGSLGTGGAGVQQPGYIPSGESINPSQIQTGYGQSLGTGGSGVQQTGYIPSGGSASSNQIQPGYKQPQNALGTGGTNVQQPGYVPSGGSASPNQIQPSYGQSLGIGGSGVQQPGYIPSGGNMNPNQIQAGYGQPHGSLGTGGVGVQPGYIPPGGNINPNQIQTGYGQPHGSLGTGGSGVQQPGYIPSDGNMNPNQIQTGYGQPHGSLGTGGAGVQQPGYVPSDGNISPNQIQTSYGQPHGSLGTGGAGIQQPGYVPSAGSAGPNQILTGYGQPQNSLGTGVPGVQKPGYTQSGDVYQNGPSGFQPVLDGKRIPGNYPESYGDNNYRGQQFVPGSQIGNNYQSSNPIIGGQFGTDISSGGSVTPIDTEGGDAQSMTNVNVDGKETSASASAQGKSKSGMTQTQVSGSYAGTGTFTAQAQTSDSDKGAQSHIVSNTNGTTSTAQGRGGKGQAQSQVLYNSESGIAIGESQSSGINYGTNTQLQAGIKGGVADAQSTGPGSTSSQAQIGFLPHELNNDTNQKSLFKGGGTASSQGGSYNGQSQSQLFGSYKYGISYNGAAQASSGKKLPNLPKLNLDDAKHKIGQLEESNNETKVKTGALQLPQQTGALQQLPQQTGASPQTIPNPSRSQTPFKTTSVDNNTEQNISSKRAPPSVLPTTESDQGLTDNDSEYEDGSDDYEDEKVEDVNTKSAQTKEETNPKQVQNIILNLDDKHDAQITRDSDSQLKTGQVLDAGQIIPGTNGTKIPDGFRGRVASVAGDHTEATAIPGGQAQTQTVLLTPGAGGLTVVDKTKLRALLGKESFVGPASRPYNRFQTDANGETGKFKPDDKNVQYFTKSSTCGYFSFSCNYVDGAKSGPKICKPNPPPFPCQSQRSN